MKLNLRTIRFLKDISQHQLQAMTNNHVFQSRISLHEKGLTQLRDDEKAAIEKALDMVGAISWGDEG